MTMHDGSTTDVPDSTYRLAMTPGMGPRTWRSLRNRFGDDDAICSVSMHDLSSVPRIGALRAQALYDAIRLVNVDADRAACERHDATLVLENDPRYPAMLAPFDDAPLALWMRGEITPEDAVSVSIVGSRRCTAYGQLQASTLSAGLAEVGMTIVSGGARGIDGEAHSGALRAQGRTIAVLGCGFGHPYPSEHARLFETIVHGNGALLSEHPIDVRPKSTHFPRRNRLIAAMSLGVIVIEAAQRSGALITARFAAEAYGREVMVVPGRIDSPASRGCLDLLRRGHGALIRSRDDVLEDLAGAGHLIRGVYERRDKNADAERKGAWTSATPAQRAILELLSTTAKPMLPDTVASTLEASVDAVMSDLTTLELSGVLVRDHRGLRLAGAGVDSRRS